MNTPDREPDYRFTLANERTYLAWVRTSLAITAGAVAVVHLVPGLADSPAGRAFAVLLALVGGTLPVVALRRWRTVQAAMRRDGDLPFTPLPALMAVFLVLTASVVVVLLMTAR